MEIVFEIIKNYFVPFLLVLSVVVVIHEFGHYWVAKRCGVHVEKFSLGFGPELFGWVDKAGTRWKCCAIPLGGYVQMYGDADPASAPDRTELQNMSATDRERSFFYKPVGQRALIVAAGPAANYLFAVLVLFGLFAVVGQPYTPATVASLVPEMAAVQAGLQEGDKITRIDNQKIDRFEDIQRIVRLNQGTPLQLTFERGGVPMNLTITPTVGEIEDRFGNTHRVGRLGIGSGEMVVRQLDPLAAAGRAVSEVWYLTTATLTAVGQMLAGTRSADELGGALRIAKMSGDVAKTADLTMFVWFIAVISINLGLINLFPIPMLDGGHLSFYAIEKLRGRALSLKVQEAAMKVGLALVVALMLFATWNDLVHLKVIAYLQNVFS